MPDLTKYTNRVPFTTYLRPGQYKALELVREVEGVSVSESIRRAVSKYLKASKSLTLNQKKLLIPNRDIRSRKNRKLD